MRITPQALSLFERLSPSKPVPSVVPTTALAATSVKERVTARLEITKEGVCPYCSTPMRRTFAASQPVWLCDADRHVAPVRNGDELSY